MAGFIEIRCVPFVWGRPTYANSIENKQKGHPETMLRMAF